jgi:hypothetical protein
LARVRPFHNYFSALFALQGEADLLNHRGRNLEQSSVLNLLESMSVSIDNQTPSLQLGPLRDSGRGDEAGGDFKRLNVE